jgi:hypothetical protein
MAKGWESKSAEALAGVFEVRPHTDGKNTPDAATLDRIRQRETMLLSRTRILTELRATQNPRYRDLLNRTLADLNERIAAL